MNRDNGIRRRAENESREEFKTEIDAGLAKINKDISVRNRTGFGSRDAAAEFLDKNANALAVQYDVEIGAEFFKGSTGTYLIGKVVTNYMSGEVNVGASYLRGFSKVSGEWHSHGSNPAFWDFSRPVDLRNQGKYPVYLSAPIFGIDYSGSNLLRSYQGTECIVGSCGTGL